MNINLKFGKFLIYGLLDPITKELRYIGMSTSGLKRPKKHLMPSSYNNDSKKHYHIYNWIKSLLSVNSAPEIIVIESCDKEDLYEKEQFYISYFKSLGCTLVNKVDGGPGMLGLKHSEESKIKCGCKNKGRKLTEDTKQKMSESRSGSNHWNYGNKYSDEYKEKLSKAHKGYKMPEEQKEKIRQSMLARKKVI